MVIGTGFIDGFAPLGEVYSQFLKRPDDLHLITDYLYKVLIDVRTANFLRGNRAPKYHPVGLASHISHPNGRTIEESIELTGRLLWETVSDDKRCSIKVVLALNSLDLEALWMYWSYKWSHTQHPWAIKKRFSINAGKEIEVVAGREFIINCALQSLTLDPQFGEGQRNILENLITAQPGYEDHTSMQIEGTRKEKATNFDRHIGKGSLPFFELNDRLQKYKLFPYTLVDTHANIASRSFLSEGNHVSRRNLKGAPFERERQAAITSVIDQFITVSQNIAQVFIRYPRPTLHQFRAAHRQTFDQLNAVIQHPFSSIDKKVRKDLSDDFCIRGAWDFIWYTAIGIIRSSTWQRVKQKAPGTVDLRRLLFSVVLDTAMGYPGHPIPHEDQSNTVDPDEVIRKAVWEKYGKTAKQRNMWFSDHLAGSFTRLDLDHYDLYARHGVTYISNGPADDVEKRFFRSTTQTMDRYNEGTEDDGEDYGEDSPSPSLPDTPTNQDSKEEAGGDDNGSSENPPESLASSSSGSDNDNGGDGGATRDPSSLFNRVWATSDGSSRLPPLPPFPTRASRRTHNEEHEGNVNAPPSGNRKSLHGTKSDANPDHRVGELYKKQNGDDSTATLKPSAASEPPHSTKRRSPRRSKKVEEGDKPYRPTVEESDVEDEITPQRRLPRKAKNKDPASAAVTSARVDKENQKSSRTHQRRGKKSAEDELYRPNESETEDENIAETYLQRSTSSQRRISPSKTKHKKSNSTKPVRSKHGDRDAAYHPSDTDTDDENLSSDGLITDDDADPMETTPEDNKNTSEADSLGDFLSSDEKEAYDRFTAGQPDILYPRVSVSNTIGKKRPSPPTQHDKAPAVKRRKNVPAGRPGPFLQSSDEDSED